MINPGTDNIAARKASLEPEGWVVKLEADGKDKDGSARALRHRGKLENLELPNRSIIGTWRATRAAARSRRADNEGARRRRRLGAPARLRRALRRHWPSRITPITAKFDDAKRRSCAASSRASTGAIRTCTCSPTSRARTARSRTGPSSSRAPCCSSAAAGSTTRCVRATRSTSAGPAARDGSRQVWGETRHRVGDAPPGLQRHRHGADPRRNRRGRRRAAPTASRCSAPPTPRRLLGLSVEHGADAGRRQRADESRRRARAACGCAASRAVPAVGARASTGIGSSGTCRRPGFLNCKPPGGVRQFQTPYGVQFVEDPERQRIFVLDRRRQPQLPHHLYGRPRPDRARCAATTTTRSTTAAPSRIGKATRSSSRPRASTRTSGSPTAACRIRTSCRSSSASRGPIFDTLRYEVTVDDPGAYTQPWSSGWELRWVGGEELPAYFCQDNRS